MTKEYVPIGKYEVTIERIGQEIINVTCTCTHGSLHPGAWQMKEKRDRDNKPCWHIRQAIAYQRSKNK